MEAEDNDQTFSRERKTSQAGPGDASVIGRVKRNKHRIYWVCVSARSYQSDDTAATK